jgi:hypothetical protein
MIAEILVLAWLSAAPEVSPSPTQAGMTPLTAEASPALSQDQLATALVEELVKVCIAHPEVERAFVLVQNAPDGSPSYMFIPIFDRKVSDAALADAGSVYRKLFPGKGSLPLMLLARNTWKKTLGGVPPIYIRSGK